MAKKTVTKKTVAKKVTQAKKPVKKEVKTETATKDKCCNEVKICATPNCKRPVDRSGCCRECANNLGL